MTVQKIVAEWLQSHGYDGLYSDDCGCRLSDLFPRGCLGACKPGYLHEAGEWNIQPEPELAIPKIRPCPKCGTSDVKCHGLIWTCCECGTDWTYNPDWGNA